ncbi:hypothetical protein [Microvirga sp. 2TAF3]
MKPFAAGALTLGTLSQASKARPGDFQQLEIAPLSRQCCVILRAI